MYCIFFIEYLRDFVYFYAAVFWFCFYCIFYDIELYFVFSFLVALCIVMYCCCTICIFIFGLLFIYVYIIAML